MIVDKHGNGIYELTEEERNLVAEHNLFYDDLFKYGNSILDIGFKDIIPDYELTIYSMLYRLLELRDTLKVMTQNSLINSGFIILRSLVEVSVQLGYTLSDKDKIKERATVSQMFDIKRTAKDESAFFEHMKKIECYREYVSIINRDKPFPNWYSYCEGKRTSLEDLFKLIGWEKLYSDLYRPLCMETHEINHMETNIVPENGKFNFKPFRMFENHILLLNSILSIMVPMLHQLMEVYGTEALKFDWNSYEKKTIAYIEDNHRLSQIGKLFDPLQKWF